MKVSRSSARHFKFVEGTATYHRIAAQPSSNNVCMAATESCCLVDRLKHDTRHTSGVWTLRQLRLSQLANALSSLAAVDLSLIGPPGLIGRDGAELHQVGGACLE